ncbi:MAG: polysaccharide lyase, partial [Leptolyngbyaceae bacterium]|nr:polysaccharide lyase [Leptolyngbyaceae bacterium]
MPRPTPTTILTTVIEDDFEGPLSKIWRVETAQGRSYSLNLVDSPEESGKAARFELHSDDPYVAGNVRAELASPSGEPGVERWYYFSIYIPEDWEFDHQSEVFAQWHPVPDKDLGEQTAEGPPLIMYIDGNQISITNRSDPAAVTSADSPTRRAEMVWEGAYEKGEWIDWAVRVKWSYESDGILQIWKDEQLLVDQKGPNSYNDARSPYLKLGIYKFVWKPPAWLKPEDYSRVDERVLYLDDVLIQEVVESPDSSDGNGSQDGGSDGGGSQDDGSQGGGSQDGGSQGGGSQDGGSQGSGSQDDGSQDDGSQDGGSQDGGIDETPTRILGTRKGDRHVG